MLEFGVVMLQTQPTTLCLALCDEMIVKKLFGHVVVGRQMTFRTEIVHLAFHEVNASRWTDFERLFENRGGPKSCWCMLWRATPAEAKRKDGASRKAAIAGRVSAGVPVGLLGYLDGEREAWCSVAPRSTYRRLVRAAVEHARAYGARIVEAYPVDPDSPSYRFMGFVPVFKEVGFCEVGRAGTRRHVMQLKVTQ